MQLEQIEALSELSGIDVQALIKLDEENESELWSLWDEWANNSSMYD